MTPGPLVRPLEPAPRPAEAGSRAASLPYTLWLDSALRDPEIGRYSFLALDPFLVLRSHRGETRLLDADGWTTSSRRPLDELERLLERHRLGAPVDGVPFQGGAAGYFGYEVGRELEKLPPSPPRRPDLPEMQIGFYDVVVGWDHATREAWIVSTGLPTEDRVAAGARERAERIEAWLGGRDTLEPQLPVGAEGGPVGATAGPGSGPVRREPSGGPDPRPPSLPVPARPGLRSTFSPDGYEAAVRRAVEYVRAGDVFQVNLSQRFTSNLAAGPAALYRRLREANPAPFAALMTTPDCTLASSSPERFLRVSPGGVAETRPIKGTRPRGRHPRHDMHLEFELAESEKDRSENLMIVDLLRNDLSRVCRPGSVRVPALFRRETYATVHHLVSVVTGRLEEDLGRVDLLRATFPGGSVTGAPKIRAMEIIAELEPVWRGPYCGSVGYLGFDGSMDSSITIRTLVAAGDRVHFHAGGAVVADSNPRQEYLETLDKAEGMFDAVTPSG